MINVKVVADASVPAVLMRFIIQTAVQTSFLTGKWRSMRRLSAGMFASFDPVALDQACAYACLKATPIENSQLGEHLAEPGCHCHHDHFKDSNPNIEWEATLDQAEKIGLGTRQYELKRIK